MPRISAIILCTKAGKDTAECALLLRQMLPPEDMEILVVDNHSEDDSVGILRNRLKNLSNVRILEAPRNLGFGKGYDIGIRQARGTYILINNPVKRLTPGSLQRMIDKMDSEETIGILAPKLTHGDGSVRLSPRRFPQPIDVIVKRTFLQRFFAHRMRTYLQLDDSLDRERDTDWVGGGCILVRAAMLSTIGSFDPRFFLFFEDTDLCRRAWAAGFRVTYFPQAVATDRKRRFSEMSAFKMPFSLVGRAHLMSGVRYFWKWYGKPLPHKYT